MPVSRPGGLKRGPLFDTNIPATEIDKDIFTDQEVEATIAGDDLILMLDVSETPDVIKYMTRSNFTAGLTGSEITVTDNESTDENNLIPFVADAGTSTGSHAIEMDGTLHYNPSTGKVTATTFAGALSGNATTATALASGRTIAMTGDVAWTSASFDGSGNVTGTGTIQANAVDYSMLDTNIISSQTEITSGLVAADEFLYSDAGVLKKVGLDTLVSKLAGTGLSATSGVLDVTVTGDITAVTAGVGLSGGGSSGDVTLTLDLSELSTVTPADGDFFSTLDSDGANEQKTTTTALATLLAGTGLTASSSVIGVDAAQTQITSVGTIGTGVWEGTTVAVAQGGTGATSLSNLITLATHTTGDYVQNITGGTGIDSTGATSGENIAHSLSIDLAEVGEVAIANGDYIAFMDATDSNATKKEAIADVATLFAGTGLTASSSVLGVDASQTQVTAVGTIATGTWEATDVGVAHGGTGVSTLLTNAILTGNGASAIQAETDLLFSSNKLIPTASAHDAAGTALTMSAGATTAGTSNNQAGGALTFQGGQGKGSGAGGAIIFQTSNAAGSGSSLNALATRFSIEDGGKATFTAGFDVGSDAAGDVLYHNGTSYVRLAKGSDDEVLTLASGVPSWASSTVGDITGVTAGVGLSGGGSGGDVTLTLDLSELSTVTPADGDFFSTLDSDGSNEQKTTTTALATLFAGTGLSASSSVLSVDAAQTGITSIGTQAANVAVGNGYGVVIGTATQETVSVGDGATDLVPELQVLGTAAADSSMLLAAFSTTATTAGSPILAFAKGGHGTLGSHTIVTDGEELGNIIAFGDDGADLETPAASIQFEVDGTPGTADMPGRIVFSTTADGATAVTERLRIGATGLVTFANGFVVGSDAEGDILYSNGTNYVRLAKGSDNQTLMMDGNVPNWETAGSGITAGFAIAMAIAL